MMLPDVILMSILENEIKSQREVWHRTTYMLGWDQGILQTMPEKKTPVTRFWHIIATNI